VFFTGLRFDYAPVDAFDLKLFVANGWNNSIDNNTAKTFGGQIMLKPADSLIFYVGGAAGPEQTDFLPAPGSTMATMTPGPVPGADSHWRGIVDLVVDFNPLSTLSFALNADYDTESQFTGIGTPNEVWYGVNLGVKWVVADPFAIALRGEYFHDNHCNIIGCPADPTSTSAPPTSSSVESGTLTLSYVAASHLTLMLDNRVDAANSKIFEAMTAGTFAKTMFTTTLGAIIATK